MLITGDAVEMPSKFVPSKIIVTRAVYAFLLSVWWYRSPPHRLWDEVAQCIFKKKYLGNRWMLMTSHLVKYARYNCKSTLARVEEA